MQAEPFNLQLSNPDSPPQNTAFATKAGALPGQMPGCGLNFERPRRRDPPLRQPPSSGFNGRCVSRRTMGYFKVIIVRIKYRTEQQEIREPASGMKDLRKRFRSLKGIAD